MSHRPVPGQVPDQVPAAAERTPPSDRSVVLAAVATAAASRWPGPTLAPALGIVAVVVLLVSAHRLRRPLLCLLVPVMVVPTLASRSLAGLVPPERGRFHDVLTLVDDPAPAPGGVRVVVRWRGKRLSASVTGASASVVRPLAAGERIEATFQVRPWAVEPPAWAVARHLAGRVTVSEARFRDGGSWPWRAAAEVRRWVAGGARSLSDDDRALFAGFVLGDGRQQSVAVVDDFRSAGLSHLLVVSGQNVAFALAVVAPVLSRLGPRLRVGLAFAVMLGFGTLTRWEPSVLRAVAMMGAGMWSSAAGRPQPAIRVLAVVVTLLVLVDPLLTRSLGFGLSVSATASLIVLRPVLVRHLAGPRWWREPLAATLAAQIGTGPLLMLLPGGVSAASVPANLLALPAAEPLTIWGLAAGVPAGIAGGRVAAVLHVPTRVLLWWVGGVARTAAVIGPGLGGVVVVAATGLALLLHRRRPLLTAVMVLAALGVGLGRVGPLPGTALDGGATVWRPGALLRPGPTVVLVDRPDAARLLTSMRRRRIGSIDVLVVARATNATWTALIPVLSRHRVGLVVTAGRVGQLPGGPPLVGLGDGDRLVSSGPPALSLIVTCTTGRSARCRVDGPTGPGVPT